MAGAAVPDSGAGTRAGSGLWVMSAGLVPALGLSEVQTGRILKATPGDSADQS